MLLAPGRDGAPHEPSIVAISNPRAAARGKDIDFTRTSGNHIGVGAWGNNRSAPLRRSDIATR
jgi:hypothetical protein